MDKDSYLKAQFESAAAMLPQRLREAVGKLPEDVKASAEEFRLRVGRPFSVCVPGGESVPDHSLILMEEELSRFLEIISHGSVHTVLESLKAGFVTVTGGHRAGVCGTGAVKDGRVAGMKYISSANLRIAKEIRGVSEKIAPEVSNPLVSTLIVSPPGFGKTTLLRDLVRVLSDGGIRVSVADERSEIAAMERGVPQFDIGRRTDVLDAVPKAEAVMMLLKTMSPELIAADEITAPSDIEAMERAANCGVKLLATVHAENRRDLSERLFYNKISRLFKKAVFIEKKNGLRSLRVEAFSQ